MVTYSKKKKVNFFFPARKKITQRGRTKNQLSGGGEKGKKKGEKPRERKSNSRVGGKFGGQKKGKTPQELFKKRIEKKKKGGEEKLQKGGNQYATAENQ